MAAVHIEGAAFSLIPTNSAGPLAPNLHNILFIVSCPFCRSGQSQIGGLAVQLNKIKELEKSYAQGR